MTDCVPILYTAYNSSCTFRVRIALALKGVKYESKAVNLLTGDQYGEFIKVNPMAQVPAFVSKGRTLCQSMVILEFLEETHSEVPLLPSHPYDRAVVRELAEIVTSGIQPLTNDSPTEFYSNSEDEQLKWMLHWTHKGFTALETRLRTTAGKYSFGDKITIADLCLVPQVFNATKMKADLSKYPNITRIYGTLMEMDAFKAAHPYSQPDCPPERRWN